MFDLNRRARNFAALAILALSSAASAQCLGPDNLSGPCCSQTTANLPDFEKFDLPGTTICWTSCIPGPQEVNRVRIAKPVRSNCTQYLAPLTIVDATGIPFVAGTLLMDYTRTWTEVPPLLPPTQLQVYRFAVKIDLAQVAGASITACNTPTCLPSQGTAFYYGYLDYSYDCLSGEQSNTLVLFHNCDAFIHAPLVSSKPGVFHPGTSYALVWPSTALNPFVAASIPAPGGALVGEASRLQPPVGIPCITEDPISSGSIIPVGNGCGCPLTLGLTQITGRDMNGVGSCPNTSGLPGTFGSLNVFPAFPWFEVMSTSIGSWTTMATYPGIEQVWVDEGVFLVRDACSDVLLGQLTYVDVNYGGSTGGGYMVMPNAINPTITQNLTDLAANMSFPLPGGVPFPLVGTVIPSRGMLYLNF